MKVDQKFIVMLRRVSATATDADVDAKLRALFADLRGCKVLSLVQRDRYVTVTLVGDGFAALYSDKQLRADVESLTDRARDIVQLDDVRSVGVSGTLAHVSKILGAGRGTA